MARAIWGRVTNTVKWGWKVPLGHRGVINGTRFTARSFFSTLDPMFDGIFFALVMVPLFAINQILWHFRIALFGLPPGVDFCC